MGESRSTGGKRGRLSLLIWALLAALLVMVAYFFGAGLAERWLGGASLAAMPTLAPTATPVSSTATPAAGLLKPAQAVEGVLAKQDEQQTWAFEGQAGQGATIEVWFHPGGGSNLDATLTVRLVAPDGQLIAEDQGDLFLPPYLVASALPAGGVYQVQVAPTSGAPGRYSLLLTLADASGPVAPLPSTPAAPVPTEALLLAEQLHFQWPAPRRAISGWTFHDPRNPGHIGLDIAAWMYDPIVAVADGVVTFAEWGGGYGNLVIVEHGGGWRSYYAHLSEIAVEQGQLVRQGELLGGAGSTGYSTGPHLHFELRYEGRPVDPQLYLQ